MTAVCCQGLASCLRLRLRRDLESRQSPFSLLFIIQMLISKLSNNNNNNCSQMLSNFNWAICVILIYIFKQQQLRNEQIKFSKCCPQIVWVVGVAAVTAAVVVVVCQAVFPFAVNVTASRCGGIGCKFFVLWSRFWGNIHSNNNNNIQQQQQHLPLSLSVSLSLSNYVSPRSVTVFATVARDFLLQLNKLAACKWCY